MTVMQYVAQQTIRMAEALAHFIQTSHEDRLTWRPGAEGDAPTRSILEQVGECVQVNHLFAALLRGESISTPSGPRPDITFVDAADAQRQLLASAEDLSGAIRGLSEADIERIYQHPRGPMRGENMILMGYRNMAYHAGQINFIQTLYGDMEFHVPPNWR